MDDPVQQHADAYLTLWLSLVTFLYRNGKVDLVALAAQVALTRDSSHEANRGVFYIDVVNLAIEALLAQQYGGKEKIPEATRKSLLG